MSLEVNPLEIEVAHVGPSTTLRLAGELDPHTAPRLQQVLDRTFDAGLVSLRLDLSQLRFIDSAGLRVIIGAHRRLADGLVIEHPSPTTRRLLELTGLIDHLRVEA